MPISINLDPVALAKELSGKLLINGALVPAVSAKTFDVVSPATRVVVGAAAFGEVADVDAAVAAAKTAQSGWAKLTPRERGRLVAQCGRLLEAHAEELARLMCLETGKALRSECRVEAKVLTDAFEMFGGLGSEIKGETVPHKNDML